MSVATRPFEQVDALPEGLTSQSHEWVVRADLLENGTKIAELPVIDGAIDLACAGDSRSSLTLTVANENREFTLGGVQAALSPYGNEVQVWRGVRMPDWDIVVPQGIFPFNDATDDGAGQISIASVDRSAYFIDSPFTSTFQVAKGTLPQAAILSALFPIYPDLVYEMDDPQIPLPQLQEQAESGRWNFCMNIAMAIGYELFFDRRGVLIFRPWQGFTGAIAAHLQDGDNLVDCVTGINRDDVFNYVKVTAENPSNEDAPIYAVAYDNDEDSPTYYFGKFPKKPFFWQNQFVTTVDQCRDAASALLLRKSGSPQVYNFTVLPDPSLNVGQVVSLSSEDLEISNAKHLVDNLTIPLNENDDITGNTRISAELFDVGE